MDWFLYDNGFRHERINRIFPTESFKKNFSNHLRNLHCVKSFRIRSFSGPYFPIFGLNTKIYGVSLRIQSE